MRFIPSKIHGVIDYFWSLMVIAIPWLLHFNHNVEETWILVGIGIFVIIYSLCTRYELSLFKAIPFSLHLNFDLVIGLILIASPWVFDLLHYATVVYIAAGASAILVSIFSEKKPNLNSRP